LIAFLADFSSEITVCSEAFVPGADGDEHSSSFNGRLILI
jgi:hypothetical protein